MVRLTGMLAALVFLVVLCIGAIPQQAFADTPTTAITENNGVAMGEDEKDEGKKPEKKKSVKKGPKYPYAKSINRGRPAAARNFG